MVSFPASLDTFTSIPSNTTQDVAIGGRTHRAFHIDEGDAIEALEAKVGTGASTPTNVDDILYVTGSGATSYGKRGLVKIAEVSGTGSSGVLTFSSIPATYRELNLDLIGRSSTAATNAAVQLAFNADATAANYIDQYVQGAAATVSGAENIGANGYISAGAVSAASSTANVHATLKIMLPEYANTGVFKPVSIINAGALSSASGFVMDRLISGVYKSTNAIASLTLTLSAGNWTTTSRATLWGKAA